MPCLIVEDSPWPLSADAVRTAPAPARFSTAPKHHCELIMPDGCLCRTVRACVRDRYDDPLLSFMYVDKALRGARAVQTLGRLSRIPAPTASDDEGSGLDRGSEEESGGCQGPAGSGSTQHTAATAAAKADQKRPKVVDFVNLAEHIQEAFEEFAGETTFCTGVFSATIRSLTLRHQLRPSCSKGHVSSSRLSVSVSVCLSLSVSLSCACARRCSEGLCPCGGHRPAHPHLGCVSDLCWLFRPTHHRIPLTGHEAAAISDGRGGGGGEG